MSKNIFPRKENAEINCLSLILFRLYKAYWFYSITNAMEELIIPNSTGYIWVKLIYYALPRRKEFILSELWWISFPQVVTLPHVNLPKLKREINEVIAYAIKQNMVKLLFLPSAQPASVSFGCSRHNWGWDSVLPGEVQGLPTQNVLSFRAWRSVWWEEVY